MVEGGGDLGVAGGVGRLAQVCDGHAGGKGAGKLNMHGSLAGLHDVWIDEVGNRARVVYWRIVKTLICLVRLLDSRGRGNT